ncbi:MAG: polymer-forming cytoskeletal protein [Haloarculaceae archaeon]
MKTTVPTRAILLVAALVVALVALPGAAAMPATGPSVTDAAALTAAERPAAELPADADAAETVVVHGTVRGDVTTASGSVRVTGEVTGEVSAASGSVTIAPGARVGEDVASGGGSIEIGSGATVEGDAAAGAGSVVVPSGASVGGDVAAGGGDAEVNGTVEGSVASGESVVLGSTAVVGGDVTYRESLQRADGARVDGTVTQREDDWRPAGPEIQIEPTAPTFSFVPGFVPAGLAPVYWTVLALFVGAVLLALFPRFSAEVATRGGEDPIRSTATGIVSLVAVPLALVAFLLTVVGIPMALAGGAIFVLSVWAGLVYGEFLVGRQVLRAAGSENRWLALLAGVVGVEALSQVPLLGGLVTLAVLVVGLGALALAAGDRWRGDADGSAGTPETDAAPRPA